jgi:predicted nucleic acid-binding protein
VAANQFILDASVAVKWLLPPSDEEHVTEALELLRLHDVGAIEFLVPDLFWVEFASAAQSGVRRKRWTRAQAADSVRDMLGYELQTFPSRLLVETALMMAIANNCSLHDCIYVALAEEAGCEMITADERLLNALGSRFPVRWLGSHQQMR